MLKPHNEAQNNIRISIIILSSLFFFLFLQFLSMPISTDWMMSAKRRFHVQKHHPEKVKSINESINQSINKSINQSNCRASTARSILSRLQPLISFIIVFLGNVALHTKRYKNKIKNTITYDHERTFAMYSELLLVFGPRLAESAWLLLIAINF